ncbi:hypothetical protein ACKI2N_007680 [Cupriavidus sp. 30B13]|uniref:hypothetical protein n=1 Tax=Cupriavidus sp. 30B13 TaxID=3384241 RepID=UPI003B8ECE89
MTDSVVVKNGRIGRDAIADDNGSIANAMPISLMAKKTILKTMSYAVISELADQPRFPRAPQSTAFEADRVNIGSMAHVFRRNRDRTDSVFL